MATKDILITAGLDLSTFGSDVNRLTDTLTKLDSSLYGQTFTHANEVTQAFRNFGGAILNASEAIPVFGAQIKNVGDAFASSYQDINDINVGLTIQAENYEQLSTKFVTLQNLRTQARSKDHGPRLAYEEAQITLELTRVTDKYTSIVEQETAALNDSSIATIRRTRLAKIDIEAQAQIAAIAQRLKNPKGELSPQALSLVGVETKRILAEAEITKQALQLTLKREEAERDINNIKATRGTTINDELSMESAIQDKIAEQLALLKTQNKDESLLASQLRAQQRDSELREIAIRRTRDNQIKDSTAARVSAEATTESTEAQTEGSSKLAEQIKMRAEYAAKYAQAERNIADAQVTGNAQVIRDNEYIIEELKKQQEIDEKKANIAIEQETADNNRTRSLAQRGITYHDQLQTLQDQRDKVDEEIKAEAELGDLDGERALALQLQRHEIDLQTAELVHQHSVEALNAALQTRAMAAQLSGNQLLATQAEIRAKYETQIADARRLGNKELATELGIQQRMDLLKAGAEYNLKTPGQRHAERQSARKFGRALQREASRERTNANADARGVHGRVSQRDYVPASAQRAISGAGGNKVGTLQVSTLNVQTIKTAP